MLEWSDLFTGLALFLVFEGLMPFVNPQGSRRVAEMMRELPDKQLRTIGAVSMGLGLVVLYIAH
jgi:uncharacterized protein YjeT (DUF2065 family)